MSVFSKRAILLVSSKHKFKNEFKRVATENNVRQRSKDIYKSLNVINQEIQARGHHYEIPKLFFRHRNRISFQSKGSF